MGRLFCIFLLAMSTDLSVLAGNIPDLKTLEQMTARFAPTPLKVDLSHLSPGDRRALGKLIEAGHEIDRLFLQQLWSGNEQLYRQLSTDHSPLGRARFHLFWISKGPWSDLDEHRAFLPGVPERKPLGANFYPPGMTQAEFEKWTAGLPQSAAEAAKGFFTVIEPDKEKSGFKIVPYRQAYAPFLQKAAALLRQAASETDNTSLKHFLELRAKAFLDDNYYESDLAWMDLDAPIDVTIGPYETYNDELFGYKAAFEAYICLKDDEETNKLKNISSHLQDVENSLPIDRRYKNAKLATLMPIHVVNQVLSAGDGNHGVQTAAYNLPNDERVIQQKGSKKVMLKNVQHAKFDATLIPISQVALSTADQKDLSFDWFFTHILAHEMSHGIGPHEIQIAGKTTSVRLELKDLYSTIEEAKADITGLFMVQYFFDHGILPKGPRDEEKLYATFLASSFRTLRFGVTEAHARGMALQFNYLLDHGAFVVSPDGRFAVDYSKVKQGVRGLTHELLTIEAQGNYHAAKTMLDNLGVIRPSVQKALDRMAHIPVDIEPKFVTAEQLVPSIAAHF